MKKYIFIFFIILYILSLLLWCVVTENDWTASQRGLIFCPLKIIFLPISFLFYSLFFGTLFLIVIPFVSIPIILIALLIIIWVILPTRLYKKTFIRRLGLLFSAMMLLIFLFSIWLLFNLPPRGAEEPLDITSRSAVSFYSGFGIMISPLFLFFLIFKTRKALKELKQENEQCSIIKADLKYVLITIVLLVVAVGILVYPYLFRKTVKRPECEIGKKYRYVTECKCPEETFSLDVYDQGGQYDGFICKLISEPAP